MLALFSIPIASANGMDGSYRMLGTGYMIHPFLGTLLWLVVLIDLILLGIWLFQKISKK